jgi:hypothetical protein
MRKRKFGLSAPEIFFVARCVAPHHEPSNLSLEQVQRDEGACVSARAAQPPGVLHRCAPSSPLYIGHTSIQIILKVQGPAQPSGVLHSCATFPIFVCDSNLMKSQ